MIKQVIVILEVLQPDREQAVNASYKDRDVLQVHWSDFFLNTKEETTAICVI